LNHPHPVDQAIGYAAVGLIEDYALRDGLQVSDALVAADALVLDVDFTLTVR